MKNLRSMEYSVVVWINNIQELFSNAAYFSFAFSSIISAID